MGWYSEVSRNINKIPDAILHFESELLTARQEVKLKGNVEKAAAEYLHVYQNVLGRSASIETDKALIDARTLETVKNFIAKTVAKSPEAGKITELQSAKMLLDISLTQPLSDVLVDIVESLPSIAKQLEKENPYVHIHDSNIRINTPAHELLNNVFAHILRNSLDHGIELPHERRSKNPEAFLVIRPADCGAQPTSRPAVP